MPVLQTRRQGRASGKFQIALQSSLPGIMHAIPRWLYWNFMYLTELDFILLTVHAGTQWLGQRDGAFSKILNTEQ